MPKRRDSRGRLLKTGESQRADGMYMYRYTDANGERHAVYSWRLTESDKIPDGKRAGEPLRDYERRIARDAEDGIKTHDAETLTFGELYDRYIGLKHGVKQSTISMYQRCYTRYLEHTIGAVPIANIRYSDVKKLYLSFLTKKHLSMSTVRIIHNIIHPVLDVAVRDGYIRNNPSDGMLREVRGCCNDARNKRHPLTRRQQEQFVDYIRDSRVYSKYLNLFTVFLGTGCRASEIIGLRWDDCDFESGTISINHSITSYHGKNLYVSTPKTDTGIRTIPMLNDVKTALLDERKRQSASCVCQEEFDGYSNFVFVNSNGRIHSVQAIDSIIYRIIQAHNSAESALALSESREPELLPKFSVHTLRHTFCTRFVEHEANLKAIQEIMGHANITTTMNVYAEATEEQKRVSINALEGNIVIR